MENLFKVIELNESTKIGNLTAEAHSHVKSKKYFPIYLIDGKKMIFKPLSKTKPYTTPFFAFSEVYWSYIINKYFDQDAPRYYLATSKEIEKEQPKYFGKGVLVESLTPNNERLINLYDFFDKHPDPLVDIKTYINYCMELYDYTKILSSEFIKNNKEIGENLAYQILLSILRQDQNFHYENISFLENGESLTVAPPIDFEFSTPFLFPDNLERYYREKNAYDSSIEIKDENDEVTNFCKFLESQGLLTLKNVNTKNICQIVRQYPDVVSRFIKNLERLIEDLPNIKLNDPDNYIGPLNSNSWEVGHAYYKEKDEEKARKLQKENPLINIDKENTFNRITSDVLEFSKQFCLILKIYLISHYTGIINLEDITMKGLIDAFGIQKDVTIEDIDIKNKQIKLVKRKNNSPTNPSNK